MTQGEQFDPELLKVQNECLRIDIECLNGEKAELQRKLDKYDQLKQKLEDALRRSARQNAVSTSQPVRTDTVIDHFPSVFIKIRIFMKHEHKY